MPNKLYDEDEKRKRFYSVKEASKILGVSTNTIYKYLDEGSLKGRRLKNRGRFKIPFSEIAPYLSGEESANTGEEPTNTIRIEKAQVDKKAGAKLTFFELWFGASLVGLILLYLLWNFGQGAAASQFHQLEVKNTSSLLTDIGKAALGYSGRTFSGFGSLISRALPTQKPTNEAQSSNEIVNEPLIGIVSKGDIPDLNYKLQDTAGRTFELYVNAQVLSSSSQKLLGQSRTLTAAELNDSITGMSLLLGSLSDSSNQKTIFAEINWLDEAWNFPTVDAIKRSASQVSYILDSLKNQSLGAFTKPQLTDLNDLVSETEALQRLVGMDSDSSTDKTLYGSTKGVEFLARTLDAKSKEIDKILGSWESYDASGKENTVKSILSESLSINTLAKIDEVLFSEPSGQDQDTELKNSLLSAKGVLEANKTHLAQPSGQPVVAAWLESGGNYFKALIANPSATVSQDTTLKYYLPVDIKRENISQIDEGLKLNFDSEKNQYYVEASLSLVAGEAKMLSLKVNDIKKVDKKDVVAEKPLGEEPPKVLGKAFIDKPSDKVVLPLVQDEKPAESSNPPANAGQVAAAKTFNYPTRSILVWGLIIAIFISGLLLLVIFLKATFGRRNKKSEQEGSDERNSAVILKETSILLPEEKLNVDSLVSAPRRSLVSFSFPRMEFRAIKTFFVSVISAIKKGIVSIKMGISSILASIKKFFTSLVTGFGRLITSFITSLNRGFFAIVNAIKKFFVDIISAVRKIPVAVKTGSVKFLTAVVTSLQEGLKTIARAITKFLVSVKTGLITILVSTITFISKLFSSAVKLAASVITGLANLVVSASTSLTRGFLAIIHAIKRFFVSVVSAFTKFLVSVKTGFVAILVSTKNLIERVAVSLKGGFLAIVHASKAFLLKIASSVTTFLANVISAVRKAITSIVIGLQKILVSIVAFFFGALFLTVNLTLAIVTSLRKVASAIINAAITLLANILSTITKTITSFMASSLKVLLTIVKGLLNILNFIAKLTDSALSQLKFEAPVRKSNPKFHSLAVLILVALASAIISSVLALTVMAQIDEAPSTLQSGYLLPTLRREWNPSEAKNSWL